MANIKNDRITEYTDSDVIEELVPQTEIPKQREFYKIPRRFGSIPVDELPLGCDIEKQYYKIYPRVALPFQKANRVTFGYPDLEPNRLFWGDNLHVMRMLPSNSIDLIYIDPPFFSDRNYNVLFGDQNEIRSFTDIWEGGMPTYLIWLNSRLLEMKRLLKSTGTLFIHLDWHAVHYVKIELDKIFGYDNFRNEIIWKRSSGHPLSIKKFEAVTDTILVYSKSEEVYFSPVTQPLEDTAIERDYTNKDEHGYFMSDNLTGGKGGGKEAYEPFNGALPPKGRAWAPPRREKLPEWAIEKLPKDYEKMNQLEKCKTLDKIGLIYWTKSNTPRFKRYLPDNPTKFATNLWDDINALSSKSNERIGYPTQKPEPLLERIIKSSTKEGDVVADFFCGGGTTPSIAQKLNRRWIASDQSRVAVAITQGRLESLFEDGKKQLTLTEIPDISIEYWGTYEVPELEELDDDEFRDFIISAYGGRPSTSSDYIHGFKRDTPIFVGSAKQNIQVTKNEVINFARDISEKKGKKQGIMLAWSFAQSARLAVEKLMQDSQTSVDLIQISLTEIESAEFREHVTKLHNEYESYLKFILPPEVIVHHKKIKSMTYEFDATESIALNSGATIVNIQWDLDYKGRFTPSKGFAYGRDQKGAPLFKIEYKFEHIGKIPIACRVQDDLGGEKIYTEVISVS